MLVLTGVINYLDRSTLSIANKDIGDELHLSLGQMGLLLTAFSWSYAFAQLPTGALVDKIGPRILLAAGLGIWSVAQACGGLVHSLRMFIVTRMALGVGEAPQFPAGARVVRDWYSSPERGLPTGLFNSSSSIGPALAPPVLTILMSAFGWRWMFFIMGAAGIAASVAWYLLYRSPHAAGLSKEELDSLEDESGDVTTEVTLAQWLRLFQHQTTWGMVFGFAGALYLIWLYLTWLPRYLEIEHHLTTVRVGFAAAVPFVFGALGSLTGGVISDRLAARGFAPITSRKLPLVAGLLGMAFFTVPAALVSDANLAVLNISVAVFCGCVATANAWALVTVTAPASYVASLGSIQNFGGYFGGSFAPLITGFVVERTGSFAPALITGAAVAVASAVVYSTMVRRPITLATTENQG